MTILNGLSTEFSNRFADAPHSVSGRRVVLTGPRAKLARMRRVSLSAYSYDALEPLVDTRMRVHVKVMDIP